MREALIVQRSPGKGMGLIVRMKLRPRIIWNREMKKLAFAFVLVAIVGLLLQNIWMALRISALRGENQIFLATVLGNVAALYPEVDESQVVQALNDTVNLGTGEKLLEKYGIFMSGSGAGGFVGLERQYKLTRMSTNLFAVFLFVCLGLLLFVYFCIRQEKIEKIAAYMEALNRDSYSLEIEDNTDDELSSLRNEVYKLTVFMKEQAARALGQKKALADSVANISHQLKTPLTSITVLVDNLAENTQMDEGTRRRFTGEISRQLSDMSWLVATMLKLSRLEAGVVALERRPCLMKALVENAVRRLETMSELAGVAITTELPENVYLLIDMNWTVEALVNILKNAIEHSLTGGTIEIRGADNDVYSELRITDHGTGITKEEREKLFHRFYRGYTAKEDSVGIGLSLAKEIVEKQNGRISVDSEEKKGTIFSIKLLKL